MKNPDPGDLFAPETLPARFSEHVWLAGLTDFPYFVVAGDTASAIVEGGISAVAALAWEQIAGLPLKAPVKYLVAAHSHTDHVSGFFHLKQSHPDLVLTGSAETGRVLSREKIVGRLLLEDEMYGKLLVQEGRVPSAPETPPLQPYPMDLVVEHGRELDLGGVALTFLDAPGHAPGGMSVEVNPDKVLFISDAAGFADSPDRIYPMYFHNFDRYLATIEEMKKRPFEKLGLGHQVFFNNRAAGMAFLARAVEKAHAMRDDMRQRLENEESKDRMAARWGWELAGYSFFERFPQPVLQGYASLLIRRSREGEGGA